jgi:hypothetical protein
VRRQVAIIVTPGVPKQHSRPKLRRNHVERDLPAGWPIRAKHLVRRFGGGMNVCFEKAGELCKGRGYDLVSREGQVVPLRADALVWLLNRETRPDWKT